MDLLTRDYEFALRLGREAIPRLREAFAGPHEITAKPGAGIVTDTDRAMEAWVRREVSLHLPGHVVLGEEEGFTAEATGPCWVVDPIDGTTNFAAGTPLFAFSLGLIQDGAPRVAVCVDPMREEIFSAAADRGALLDGRPIRCTARELSGESCFAMPSNGGPRLAAALARVVERAKLRNTGSTVLNACYVAAGRFETCFATNSHLWDIAAASLIVLEAGGRVTDAEGRALFPLLQHPGRLKHQQYQFVCSAPHLHERILTEFVGKAP